MEKQNFSFKKGWMQVPNGKSKEVRAKLMSALKIKTRTSWGLRLNGDIEPRVSEAKAIEAVFAEYNIKEVWGE